MKFLAFVVCMTVFAAVHGTRFKNDCIQLDVEGTVTVTAHNTNTNETDKAVIDLSTVKVEKITGNCTNVNTSVMMNVAFNKASSWKLEFTNGAKVQLDQSVTFDPAVLFKNCSANASVTLPNAARLTLSASNESFECDSQQSIDFTPKTEGNCSFSISQNISSIRVQAFGLHNGTYSPAEHCAADQSTVAPTTEATTVPATTVPVPTGKPVTQETFLLKDSKGVVCFRLEAGLQFTVEYETTDNVTAYSKLITVPGSAKVNGTCATGSANTATMTISEGDYSLAITETRDKSASSSTVQLTVKLDPANFPKALHANSTVTFEVKGKFQQSPADTFYLCDTEQTLKLTSTNTSSATLYANNVKMQAFNLKNGSFSGEGVRCGLDPTPQPKPGYNTYVVEDNNTACIVLKGEISFSNVTYATKSGSTLANTINIPEMNKTSGRVTFNGSCNLEGGNAQQLVITFNTNWTLALTFVKGSSKDSSMLTAAADEFTVRDIEFIYYLVPKFFPNTTTPNQRVVASQINITGDFMKGSIKGGSYKCDAQQSETLDTGVQFQTTNLQFKAFNNDNTTTFNSNVSECSADDESNSIVPIAVGAALAGLVAIVLIAYLIGRRRSRRQGYESV